MTRAAGLASLCLLGALLRPAAAAAAAADADDAPECGLYLAVSSTSTEDSTTWGIYAGRDYASGEHVGAPELVVNTHNLRFNAVGQDGKLPSVSLGRALGFLEENFWIGEMHGTKFELDGGRSIALISGSGSLGAGSPRWTNAHWSQRRAYQRTPQGEAAGDPHPSRGAISPFYDSVLRTMKQVKAGSEIFVDYGLGFEEKEDQDELNKQDFARLDQTVDQMIEFFEKHKSELDGDSKREIYNFITKDVMNAAVGSVKAKKVAALLPRTPDELGDIKTAGGVLQYSQPSVFRSPDWIRAHGRCMDHLRAVASTVAGAGRGAFAARALKAGSIVAPVPVLQIPDKSLLDMYPLAFPEGRDPVRVNDTVVGSQLLVNYCFGHPQSTLLLAPSGSNVGLINHSDKPNARLVWSTHPNHQRQWLQLPPEELVNPENSYVGLMLDVVALRDIAEGEEVFIDYGPEWKKAWDAHTQKWAERLEAGNLPKQWPLRALDLNLEYANKPFETRKDHSYPKTVGLAVFMMLKQDGAQGTQENPRSWTEPSAGFAWEHLIEPDSVESVSTQDGAYVYTVRWTTDQDETIYVKDIPHSAFVFIDAPETSDQFTADAFRHPIGLPDEIFPQAWKNVKT